MIFHPDSWLAQPQGQVLLIGPGGPQAMVLRLVFLRANYDVTWAVGPAEALLSAASRPADLIVLNPAVLQGEGMAEFLRRYPSCPVIVLSHRPSVKEKIFTLECGADDYLGWPFHFKELMARVNNLLRRSRERAAKNTLEIGSLRLDRGRREVRVHGEPVHLTTRQFELLLYFLDNPRRFISRDELLNQVWNMPTPVETNIVETTMNVLRRKIKDHGKQLICTMRGGYSLGEVIHRGQRESHLSS